MKKGLIVCLVFLLPGCAALSTGYHPVKWNGGYSDMHLQDNLFQVEYRGNAHIGMSDARNYALLRCAEVTLESDFNYFVIVDDNCHVKQQAYTTPLKANTTGNYNSYNNATLNLNDSGFGDYSGNVSGSSHGNYSSTTTYSGGQTHVYNKPQVLLNIACFKERPADIDVFVYDAEQIKCNMFTRYDISVERSHENNQ